MALKINYLHCANELWRVAGRSPEDTGNEYRDFVLAVRASLNRVRDDAWMEVGTTINYSSPIPVEGMSPEYRGTFEHTRRFFGQQIDNLRAEAKKDA